VFFLKISTVANDRCLKREFLMSDFRFPLTINSESSRLFAVCHLPARQKGPVPVVVMCHGLGSNKVGRGRFYVLLSESLASQGIASVRFDFRGNGDSEGDFASITSGRCLIDLQAVITWVDEQKEFDHARCGLFGRSFGGLIATLGAAQWKCCKAIAVQSPPFNADSFSAGISKGLMPHLKLSEEKKTLFFEGEPLTPEFVEQLQAIDMGSILQSINHLPFLHISSGKDAIVDASHSALYQACRKKAQAPSRFVVLENADHGCSSYSDRQTALKEASDWFFNHLVSV